MIVLSFEVKNKTNTWFKNNSPVIYNGSFINNSSFPSIGYRKWELSDDDVRKSTALNQKKNGKSNGLDSKKK
jgi:ABC-2 type transport system permease protein